jgi:two-component system chemotaxis response regulator CheY
MIEKLPYDDVTALLIDDDDTTRNLLGRIIEKMGVKTVYQAKDGSDGLRLAHENIPTFVICDIQMAPVDGLAFLGGLRNSMAPGVSSTPVLMFTSEKTSESMERAKKLGIDGYLVKPFNPKGFSSRICDLVTKHYSARAATKMLKINS